MALVNCNGHPGLAVAFCWRVLAKADHTWLDPLLDEIARLNKENDDLSNDSAQDWFLRGAGTVLLGLLFGVWIGRRIYQRRNNSGWG